MKPKESAPPIDHMATIGTLLLSGVRANVLITALLSKTTFHRQGTQACRLTNRYLLSKTTFQSLADIYNIFDCVSISGASQKNKLRNER